MLQPLFRRVLSIILVLGAVWSLGSAKSASAAPNADIPLPLPNIIVNTTAIADDPNDGKCDLWEALQAVFQANYGLSPTYHECTAKPDAMNIIAFSVIGGTITLPTAPGTRTDLPFVHGNTVILSGAASVFRTAALRKVKAAQYVASHPGEVCPAKWNEGDATLAPSLDLVGKI